MSDIDPTHDEDHDVAAADALETQAEVGGDAETPIGDEPETDDDDMEDDDEDEAPLQA